MTRGVVAGAALWLAAGLWLSGRAEGRLAPAFLAHNLLPPTLLAPNPSQDQQPSWVMGPAAKPALSALWSRSISEGRERVACMGGTVARDTVHVEHVRDINVVDADSLDASALNSMEQCGPPQWIGTVHTHVRSTDDPSPAPRFSPGDRTVMSEWSRRWNTRGAFCVLYSARSAHCELYPPRSKPRELPSRD